MTLLVTGGSGFIGSNFILNWLESESAKVTNLDLLTYSGNQDNLADIELNKNYNFVRGDIGDTELVKSLLLELKPTQIVNFAAESHVDRSIHGPEAFIRTNIIGTFHLLECVREYWSSLPDKEKIDFKFLHVSTD